MSPNLELRIATTESIAGFCVAETLGVARGSSIRARRMTSDIAASVRNLVGSELKEYGQAMISAREQAFERMAVDAKNQLLLASFSNKSMTYENESWFC